MNARAALNWISITSAIPTPSKPLVEIFAAELLKKFSGTSQPPSSEEIGVIAQKIIDDLVAGVRPEKRVWRKSPWCLWNTSPAITDHKDAAAKFFDLAADSQRLKRSFVRTLAAAYLINFYEDAPFSDKVRKIIIENEAVLTGGIRLLSDATNHFDPKNGPRQLATQIIIKKRNLREELNHMGLSPMMATGGFAIAAGAVGLRILSTQLKQRQAIEDVDAIERYLSVRDGEQPYVSLIPAFISALIKPFEKQPPNLDLRSRIIELALGKMGDPRTHPGQWERNQEEAEILSRWLDEQSLQLFLDIVDEIALEQHWKYRRAFWEAWSKKGYIQNAWVVFGPDGNIKARKQLGKDIQFARLEAGGSGTSYIYDNHSVLLLKIGDLTIADWSHNSKCYIWLEENSKAPHLYAKRYLAGDLRSESNFKQQHSAPHTYSWQHDVNEFIRKHTGLFLSQSDYKVK